MFELALADQRHDVHAPVSSLRWLYDHRDDPVPPPGAQITMSFIDAPESLPAWHAVGSFHPNELENPEGKAYGSMAAFSIGHAVFTVFLQDFRGPDHRALDGRPLARFEFPSRYGGYLVPLWPDPDLLTIWPNRLGLTIADRHGFAAWQDVKISRPIPKKR